MCYKWQGTTLILNCYIQPKAREDSITGLHDGRLKIRLTAAPVDGKANKHLLKFLAQQFQLPLKRISLLSGQNSRLKRISISDPVQIPQTLQLIFSATI